MVVDELVIVMTNFPQGANRARQSYYDHLLQAQPIAYLSVNGHHGPNNSTADNEEVYRAIKEIELEEYRRRKQMVNDFAKLCKDIPLTVAMVNPLINFDGWPIDN